MISNFLRTLEMPRINCELNLILDQYKRYVIFSNTMATAFAITDPKLYVPVDSLLTQDNAKLLQLKSGFKKTINWNKYKSDLENTLKICI